MSNSKSNRNSSNNNNRNKSSSSSSSSSSSKTNNNNNNTYSNNNISNNCEICFEKYDNEDHHPLLLLCYKKVCCHFCISSILNVNTAILNIITLH